uniref:Uncharacterized protein n=1 Tax=Cyanothece sp. (strain PCC 7425 / ATCC 29141) TaxID=395961 RepID=B8HZC6_CYAP4
MNISLHETRPTTFPVAKHSSPSWLSRIWQWLKDALFEQTELQLLLKRDRYGHLWWYAYDPVTGRVGWLSSEDEVRAWIEERYERQDSYPRLKQTYFNQQLTGFFHSDR